MLQAFLLQFIPAMVQGVTLAIPLGILLAVFLRLDLPEYKNTLKRLAMLFFKRDLSKKVNKVVTMSAFILAIMFILFHGMELWLMPYQIFIGATGKYMTLNFLIENLGFLTGILFGLLSAAVTYEAAAALNYKRLLFVFFVQIIALFIEQILYAIRVAMARQFLPSGSLIKVMAPIICYLCGRSLCATYAVFAT